MAKIDPRLWQLIVQGARKYNLDPRAAAAVSVMEGGGRFGAVGDHGTSFGPWQLHVGGALPHGRNAAWANSAAGVDYALRQMAKSGAAGLKGQSAIAAIVRNFERPANPGAEIQGAIGHYGGIQGGGVPTPQATVKGTPRVGTGAFGPGQADRRSTLVQSLMGANQQFATTGKVDPTWLTSALQNGLTQADQNAMGNVKAPKGTSFTGVGGKAGQVINLAKQQIGQPYVWGGESRKEGGFDCSGLIQWAYAKAGVNIGRTTYQQIKQGRPVAWGKFQPGDLIFTEGGGHVVMYVGNGKVIAARHTGTNVQLQDVNVHKSSFVGARRILG